MTSERRIVFEFADIKAITIRCTTRSARVSVGLEESVNPPKACPRNHRWEWYDSDGRPVVSHKVLEALTTLAQGTPTNGQAGFKLLLEFEEPRVGQS